ncbi:hypothetical protein RQP46_009720 [Phenoliferia psychrophenolica]
MSSSPEGSALHVAHRKSACAACRQVRAKCDYVADGAGGKVGACSRCTVAETSFRSTAPVGTRPKGRGRAVLDAMEEKYAVSKAVAIKIAPTTLAARLTFKALSVSLMHHLVSLASDSTETLTALWLEPSSTLDSPDGSVLGSGSGYTDKRNLRVARASHLQHMAVSDGQNMSPSFESDKLLTHIVEFEGFAAVVQGVPSSISDADLAKYYDFSPSLVPDSMKRLQEQANGLSTSSPRSVRRDLQIAGISVLRGIMELQKGGFYVDVASTVM